MAKIVSKANKNIDIVLGILKENYPELKIKQKKSNIFIRNKAILVVLRQKRENFKIKTAINFSYLPILITLIIGILLGGLFLVLILLILELIFRRKILKFQTELVNVLQK